MSWWCRITRHVPRFGYLDGNYYVLCKRCSKRLDKIEPYKTYLDKLSTNPGYYEVGYPINGSAKNVLLWPDDS